MLKRPWKQTVQEPVAILPSSGSSSWSSPRPYASREAAIECALYGIAVGDSVGMRYELLPPMGDAAIQKLESGRFVVPASHGIRTHLAVSAGQSLLDCRSSATQFAVSFAKRLIGHELCRYPLGIVQRWIPGVVSADPALRGQRVDSLDSLLPTIVFLSVCLQGTTNRISPWTKALFESCASEEARQYDLHAFGKLLARMVQIAMFHGDSMPPREEIMNWLLEGTRESSVLEWMQGFTAFLEQDVAVTQLKPMFEQHLGQSLTQDDPRLEVFHILNIWLKNQCDWEKGIAQCIGLGGRTASRCSTYSGLVAIATGGECLPPDAISGRRWAPVNNVWIDAFIDRLVQWPHGKDDLVNARGQRSPMVGLWITHQLNGCRDLSRKILNKCLSLFSRKCP